MAQNEMKAKGAMPLRVRLTDGLGGARSAEEARVLISVYYGKKFLKRRDFSGGLIGMPL